MSYHFKNRQSLNEFVKILAIESLLIESNLKKFGELVQNQQIPFTEDDLSKIVSRKGKFIRPFNNDIFRMIAYNTLSNNLGHSIEDLITAWSDIENKIIKPAQRNRLTDVLIPGEGVVSIKEKLANKTLNYDDCVAYIDASSSMGTRSKLLQRILDEGFSGNTHHFEVIHEDDEWIILYPKTYQGSIATARMGPDKRYYNPNSDDGKRIIGNMSWCTSIDSASNMFLNYHRKMNLHMYYATRKAQFDISRSDRKFCLSFAKKYDYVRLTEDGATVNGNNTSVKKDVLINALGNVFYIIEADAKSSNRQEIDEVQYYRSISLVQFKGIEEQGMKDGDHQGHFGREANSIFSLTDKNDLISYGMQKGDPYYIVGLLVNENAKNIIDYDRAYDILNHYSGLASSGSYTRIQSYVIDQALLDMASEAELSESMVQKLAKSNSEDVRLLIAKRHNLPRDIQLMLIYDKSPKVNNYAIRTFEINDKIFQKLVNGGHVAQLVVLAENKTLDDKSILSLASTKKFLVDLKLLENANIPKKAIIFIAKNTDATVKEVLLMKLRSGFFRNFKK